MKVLNTINYPCLIFFQSFSSCVFLRCLCSYIALFLVYCFFAYVNKTKKYSLQAALKGSACPQVSKKLLFFCFSPSVVIVGDSNLVRLANDIDEDNLLNKRNVTVRCRPGFRAKHLNSEDVKFCSKFDLCIVMLGNNDLSQHPSKHWITPESPLKTAARICGFARVLLDKNVETRVIGLMARPDVRYELVQTANSLMQNFMGNLYVGPRKIHASHFRKQNSRDIAHLNFFGKKLVLALFLRILDTRFGELTCVKKSQNGKLHSIKN